jgi:hypothetical protein
MPAASPTPHATFDANDEEMRSGGEGLVVIREVNGRRDAPLVDTLEHEVGQDQAYADGPSRRIGRRGGRHLDWIIAAACESQAKDEGQNVMLSFQTAAPMA